MNRSSIAASTAGAAAGGNVNVSAGQDVRVRGGAITPPRKATAAT